jgi:alkylation response protein AidB-like acyl-CoA dehydrogenase
MIGKSQFQAPSEADISLASFRDRLRRWLQQEFAEPLTDDGHSVEESTRHGARLLAQLYEAGWNRFGWPTEVGGLGGDVRHRAVLYDELCRANIEPPEQNIITEVVGPALVAFAPDIAAEYLPRVLRGRAILCQGFSEPESGSDLASLRCRATRDSAGDFVLNGQKIWTSFGHLADHIIVLCRTGAPDSRSRGLTMLFVDMTSPGVEARPIRFANGRNELAEVFFRDVNVPQDRLVGEIDAGWAVAGYLLQFERGMYAWMRHAMLSNRLRQLAAYLAVSSPDNNTTRYQQRLGEAVLAVAALRARSSRTIDALAQQRTVGPAASTDKLLLAAAEHAVYDLARDVLSPAFGLDATQPDILRWRNEWFYSRAASIYGGAAEIQRSIIADRVLNLPRE